MLSIKQRLSLIAIAIGLFGCYSLFGILQERLFRRSYVNEDGKSGDYYAFPITFVCLQCIFYSLFAKVILLTHDHTPNETPQRYYAFAAIFYLVALITSNSSLQYLSYPTQVIGKALKPIPTMLFGFLVGGKSYPIHKFVFVLLIVCGAIMFLLKSDQPTYESSYLGYSLVGISLLMNGCSAGVQEKMRAVSRPSPLNLMLFMNSWSSLFVVVGIIASGEIEGFVRFCTKHSDVLVHISLLLIVGAFGQFFSCSMITNFGVLPTSIVLTIRKFFNVLFSVIYFNNVLSLMQWLATALIFTSLLADSLLSFVIFRTDKNNDVKNCEESESQANNEKKCETIMQEKSKSLPV